MSCQLSLRSSIVDFQSILSYVKDGKASQVKNESHQQHQESENVYRNSEAEIQEQQARSPNKPSSFLSGCLVSLSPTEDLMVIGKGTRAVFLTKKYSPKTKDDPHKWNEVYWKGDLSQNEEEFISSTICVPLASQQRSSQGSPDCSCVIVGFTSGYVRIYLQTGIQLLSQFLHDGPVTGLDLKTRFPVKDAYSSDQGEELIILYPNAIVVIDGFSLFMALKACRNQIAKAQASKNQEAIQPPPLAYRKWRLFGQEKVFDIVNCGMVTPTVFDRLVVSSLNPDSRQPGSSGTRKFITSGANPFIGWYELKEENSAPLMSEVAMNVASKLTTAFISSISSATSEWIGFGIANKFKSQPAKETKPVKPPVEMGAPMQLRYGLPDKRRRAESIVLSPDGSLAACTDDFGRILVISNDNGLVVRMLKGYRDAQCGWVVVDDHSDEQATEEEKKETEIRQALFLVIYAPRRGILEIWLAEQGNRVGAFNVGKDCRLIYNGFGTLGSRISSTGNFSGRMISCFLMESSGALSSISVPFHCSLSLLHSLRARDSYLLRKVSGTLEKNYNPPKKDDQIVTLKQLFQEMEAPETLFQAVQRISSSKKLTSESMVRCIASIKEILINRVERTGTSDDIEYVAEIKGIISVCDNYSNLIELYDSLKQLHGEDDSMDQSTTLSPSTFEDFAQLLDLTEKERLSFQEALVKDEETREMEEDSSRFLAVADFLEFFTIDCVGRSNQSEIPREEAKMCMKIPDDVTNTNRLAWLLFMPYIESSVPVTQLDPVIKSPYFHTEICMRLLITYCQNEILTIPKLQAIYHIMNFVIKGVDDCKENVSNNIMTVWKPTRSLLVQSKAIRSCLLLAYLCKNVSGRLLKMEICDQANSETEEHISSWTHAKEDIDEWNKLIEKLEDIFSLATFLQKGHFDDDEVKQKNSYYSKLSIKDVTDGGKGAITQIVAAHIVRCRIPGPCVASMTSLQEYDDLNSDRNQRESSNSEIVQAFLGLQNRFPHSLERDILLAHCCWECILLWKKDIEDVSILSSAVVHLSSISSNILKQGLVLLFWKAIFKESIKNTQNLIDKIGKSPKDRLCRKHIGMSTMALEKYLFTAHSLLRQALQADDSSNIEFPEFEVERRWENTSRNNTSIIESALDEPKCEIHSLRNIWNMTVVLRLIILTGMKSITTSKLFHPEEIRAATQQFPMSSHLPDEVERSMRNARSTFCLNSLSLMVEKVADANEEDSQSEVMSMANEIFELANNFQIDDDVLWQNFTCSLFSAGLDHSAHEALLSVHQKEDLVEPLLKICGSRLAALLIDTKDTGTISKVISSMPTHITSWLQIQHASISSARKTTINENMKLLNRILSISSTQNDFVKDLIDSLEIFS